MLSASCNFRRQTGQACKGTHSSSSVVMNPFITQLYQEHSSMPKSTIMCCAIKIQLRRRSRFLRSSELTLMNFWLEGMLKAGSTLAKLTRAIRSPLSRSQYSGVVVKQQPFVCMSSIRISCMVTPTTANASCGRKYFRMRQTSLPLRVGGESSSPPSKRKSISPCLPNV